VAFSREKQVGVSHMDPLQKNCLVAYPKDYCCLVLVAPLCRFLTGRPMMSGGSSHMVFGKCLSTYIWVFLPLSVAS